jgi:hypothetical protein
MADGSLSQFKATLARKIERNQKRQARSDRNSSYSNSEAKPEYNFPKLSETELEKVKSDIRAKLKSERKREYIKISIIFVVIIFVIWMLM